MFRISLLMPFVYAATGSTLIVFSALAEWGFPSRHWDSRLMLLVSLGLAGLAFLALGLLRQMRLDRDR